MKYDPVSEKEFNERMLLPEGAYAFEVLNAVDDVSKKSGADMIVLDLLIHAEDGSNRKVKSYLVASPGGRFAVRAFAVSTGLLPRYESGELTPEDCLGKSGWLKLKIEKGKAKDDGSGNFPDKNSVASFLPGEPAKPARPAAPAPAPLPGGGRPAPAPQHDINNEDVPF